MFVAFVGIFTILLGTAWLKGPYVVAFGFGMILTDIVVELSILNTNFRVLLQELDLIRKEDRRR